MKKLLLFSVDKTGMLPRDRLISKEFFSAHILTEEEGGYFSGSDGLVSVESRPGQGCPSLTLLEGPGYRPSYVRGLHTATVQQVSTANHL